ncbi:MAG: hypothetical protein WCC39_04945 [Telluria sp.]
MRGSRWLYRMCMTTLMVALAGCASRNSVLGEAGELKPESGVGYVAATLVYRIDSADPSIELVGFPSIAAAFHAPGNAGKPAFSINTFTTMNRMGLWTEPRAALEEPRGRRVLALVQVPAGRYQLGRIDSTYTLYLRQVALNMTDPPVIEVRAGQVTYAGSIQLRVRTGKDRFGHAVPVSATLHLVDDAAGDIAAMKKVDVRLAPLAVVDGLEMRDR